jgi:hypothetical protein
VPHTDILPYVPRCPFEHFFNPHPSGPGLAQLTGLASGGQGTWDSPEVALLHEKRSARFHVKREADSFVLAVSTHTL